MNALFTEAELVSGVIAHDGKALEHIYRSFFPVVRNYILQNSGDEETAQDIFQDGMIALWDNVKNGKYESRNDKGIGAYLVQICKFRWLERTKSASFRKTAEWKDGWDSPDDHNRLEGMIKKEEVNYAVQLVAKLGEKCREILTMFYYEKKSMQEIAQAQALTAESAKNEKYRCMQRLKKMHEESKHTLR